MSETSTMWRNRCGGPSSHLPPLLPIIIHWPSLPTLDDVSGKSTTQKWLRKPKQKFDIPGLSRCKGGNRDSFSLSHCLSVSHTHSSHFNLLLSCFLVQPAALFFQACISRIHTDHNRMRASLTQLFYQSSPDKLSWDCPGTFACPWTCCCAQKIEIAPRYLWDSFSLLKPGALGVLWIEWSITKEEAACWTNKARKSLYM